jgi:esterase/lipase
MKKIYILPGYQETTRRKPYQKLRTLAQAKGYEVVFKNINWNKNLTQQIFEIEKESIIFGFSLGAILARLIVQDYPSKHTVFASMTILDDFKKGKNREALIELLGISFVDDVRDYLKQKHKALKQTIMYGDKEGEDKADVLVKNTEHELTDEYLKEILKLL